MTKFLHEQILCVSLNFKLHFCVNLESKISHGMKPSGSHGPCRSHGVLVHFENDILFNFIRSILINVLQSDDQHLSDQTITSNLYFREFFKNDSKTCLLPFEVKSSLNPIFLSAQELLQLLQSLLLLYFEKGLDQKIIQSLFFLLLPILMISGMKV